MTWHSVNEHFSIHICAQLQASCSIVLFMLQPKGSFLKEIPHLFLAIFLIPFNLHGEFDFTLGYVSLRNFCKAWWRSSAGFVLIVAWMIMIPPSTASHLYCAFNGRYSHILLRLDQTGSAMTPKIIERSSLACAASKSGGKTAKDTLFASS